MYINAINKKRDRAITDMEMTTMESSEVLSPSSDSVLSESFRLRASRLEVDKVCVRFGGIAANSDVTLTVQRGEILGLVGPNGAGKTTLVNCLSGFQRPTEGTIRLNGEDCSAWTPQVSRNRGIARTFQGARLFGALTVLENVMVPGMALGLRASDIDATARELLTWVGYDGDVQRTADSVPYVDQRRIGIARALIGDPLFLLLDEPAAGMSDAEVDQLGELITMIVEKLFCGIILIEHNMHLITRVCDRVHVLDGGKTLASGLPASVLTDPAVIGAYLGGTA